MSLSALRTIGWHSRDTESFIALFWRCYYNDSNLLLHYFHRSTWIFQDAFPYARQAPRSYVEWPLEWSWLIHDTSPKVVFSKAEKISLQSLQQFRQLLLVAAKTILEASLLCGKASWEMVGRTLAPYFLNWEMDRKRSSGHPESKIDSWLLVPRSVHYNIALAKYALHDCVRWWIESISYCYILQGPSIESDLLPSDSKDRLNVINESDVEDCEVGLVLNKPEDISKNPEGRDAPINALWTWG